MGNSKQQVFNIGFIIVCRYHDKAEKGLEPELIFDEYEITANEDMLNSAVTHKTKPG